MEKNTPFNIKKDFFSGLIVFLVALPLCLGIAQASHAPLFAGIVSGIIGGIVIGSLSRSQLSVSGPAAGLTAIVLAAITKLNAFDIFLCAVIIAGVVQLIFGFVRAGSIANFIPSSVIEGMLAGIGLTIIIKQIPDAVGFSKHLVSVPDEMVDADDGFVMNTITASLSHIETAACIIALTGLVLLILWQTKALKKLQMVPAGLIVVLTGVAINEILKAGKSPLALDNTHLVTLPIAHSFSEFIGQFTLPDFAGFKNKDVWETGIVIAIVASIETLLCIEATDKLDPLKRYTSTNRELKAQGIGNILSGFVGGLPITSVIVRSSANVNAGAQSKLSTIIHGALLLICAASIPVLLNFIPKASLAAILIFTGYKLCKPAVFVHMWKGGYNQFIPFVATVVAVVSLDLLKGVGLGLLISVIYILRENMRIPYYFQRSTFSNGELIKITLAQEVSFLNKASIKDTLDHLPKNSSVIIDAGQTQYIDYDVLDLIKNFNTSTAPERNIKMSLIDFKTTYNLPRTVTETEIVSEFVKINEIPKRTAGSYKKLLSLLKKSGE
ncbi:MAG: SulP family inorganic anion transporter [Taibaiella sp.]|nr:SulP family inorganic anion transporter [Taibaiella sp.]